MPIEVKACKNCGKVEAMGHSCKLCLSCRIKKANELANRNRRKYYANNKAKILNRMKVKRAAKDTYIGQVFEKPKCIKSRWTVEFIKSEEGYSWRAWFRNPETGRIVKFESGRTFKNMIIAKKDYSDATR